MTSLEYKEKMLGVVNVDKEKKIIVSHVTIRQSIFFLHLRLVAIEIIAAIGLIAFLTLVLDPTVKERLGDNSVLFNIPFFLFLVTTKLVVMICVIIQWLNEYYEITTGEVIFKKGFFFKKEERHVFEHIGSVKLEQGILGRIFNFGTLKLFNWTKEKYVYLYLIHNPMKYQKILEELLPEVDKSEKVFRKHILEPENDTL